jgi:PhnB protein
MNALTTYLIFDGNCREAMTFYAQCLGTDAEVMTFDQMPGEHPAGAADRVMHARIPKGKGQTLLMASDTMHGRPYHPGNNFSISVNCESLEDIEKLFAAFSEGGKVTMPLENTFWGARFGMLIDKFGVHWMFNHELPKS